MSNLLLEIVNNDKIREEGQDVFDLKKVCVIEKAHGPNKMKNQSRGKIKMNVIARGPSSATVELDSDDEGET
ncbi:vacuolar protein sorting protein [Moniliophthora roreri]|nr:vacuolar protein sorting protein [Moniliophthora roreri]